MDGGALHFIHIHVAPIIFGMLGPLERMAMRLVNKYMAANVTLEDKLTFEDVMVVLENADSKRVFFACISHHRIVFLSSYEKINRLSKLICELDSVDMYHWAHQTVQHWCFGAVITHCNIDKHPYSGNLNLFKAVVVPHALLNKDFAHRNGIFWELMCCLLPNQLYVLPWLVDMSFVNPKSMRVPYNVLKGNAIVKHNATYVYEKRWFGSKFWEEWIHIILYLDSWDTDLALFLMELIGYVPPRVYADLCEYSALYDKKKCDFYDVLRQKFGDNNKRLRVNE